MKLRQTKKFWAVLLFGSLVLASPLFVFTERASAASVYTFANRYRIDHSYQETSGGPYVQESFVLSQNAADADLYGNLPWLNTADSNYCYKAIEYNPNLNVYQLVTQLKVAGRCNTSNAGGDINRTQIDINTTKADYVLFKSDASTITTLDNAYTWKKVANSALLSSYNVQELYYESGSTISSSYCPSLMARWGNNYYFSAPYVASGDTTKVEPGADSVYYRELMSKITGKSSDTYASCYARNIRPHIQFALGKINGTSEKWWQTQITSTTGLNQDINGGSAMSGAFALMTNYIGSADDYAKNITNSNAGDSAKSSATGGGGSTSTTPQDLTDNCPIETSASMRWLGCSVFFTLRDAANSLRNQLDNYLYAE